MCGIAALALVFTCTLDAQRGAAPLVKKSSPCQERLAVVAPGAPREPGAKIPLKQVRDVAANYPTVPTGTRFLSSVSIVELLIGADGKVTQVWTLLPTKFEPPFPAWDAAFVRAVKQWEYEPYLVNGVATPHCMSMTVNIDFN